MSPTDLKMQPTLHFRKKLAIEIKISSFFRKCIVGCILNYVRLIITCENPADLFGTPYSTIQGISK
jgi:hypothetical protein